MGSKWDPLDFTHLGPIRLPFHLDRERYGDLINPGHALPEAAGSLGCRCNISRGSMLIRQQTEVQFFISSKTLKSGQTHFKGEQGWKNTREQEAKGKNVKGAGIKDPPPSLY